ncbi:MAG: arylesterase [Alphaproteobacteria bacterium]|nr:arylesterase [Alphaproteobacteria bacterium]
MKSCASQSGTLRRYGMLAVIFNLFAAMALAFPYAERAGAETAPLIVALGDSLTAGYGLPPEQAFPALLEARLKAIGVPARVQNAGVSGDTSAGGRARLAWALAERPALVIVELGANDALRGIEPAQTEANLDAILTELRRRDIKVLLAGMRAPPNMGRDFAGEYDALFPRLAAKHGVPLYPFFLDGVAGQPALNQPDGIHPNLKGVEVIVERIAPHVKRALAGAG